jgi:hypothetical protein
MTCCRFLVDVWRWLVGMPVKMVCSRSTIWVGSWMVLVGVSSTQPNTVFLVAQELSPFNNFVADAGSCRCGPSSARKPLNTKFEAVQQCSLDSLPACGITMGKSYKVIHIDVPLSHRCVDMPVRPTPFLYRSLLDALAGFFIAA